ncbi:MAG: gliding motility-associated C-terminal domain-containing protein [Chitinophagales bacterium]
MKRLFTSIVLLFLFFLSDKLYAENVGNDKYTTSFNACSSCSHEVGNTRFFDDGGENGAVSNTHTVNTFTAKPGFVLSLYFTQIDLPNGAKIKVYAGEEVNDENLVKTFYQIEKTKNITGEKLTIEYIPSQNYNNSKGWIAHIDELIPKPENTALRMSSPPESDCPYAIPLCQNNTAIALGGQYTDLGSIYDDEGSCYSGTGNGGSVWYSFSPQSSGPLDFMITPQGSTDYDFVLWDITNGCQSNKRNELACNFSLYTGTTGMNSTLCTENYGSCTSNDCSNQSKGSDCNRFNNRVNVTVGRQYAICVNFYSGSNDGFLIEFKKQASSVAITDVVPPTVTNAYSGNCSNATNFHVLFSEWVSCATIQNTDFTLAGHTFTIVNTNCVNGRTNNIDISVSPALTAGNYSVHVQDIMDLCNNNMNSNFNISLGAPPTPTMTNPQIVCRTPGLFGSFNYSPSSQTITAGGGTAYYWNDGQVGASAVFSPTSTTTVTVTVVNGSCSANISKTITVEATAVSLGPDQLYCGTPLTLTALPAIAGSTYTFYRNPVVFPPSNGTQFQTGASNTTTVSPTGYTTYRVVVTSPNGCKAQDDMAVTTNPPANATITLPGNNFCLGANPLVLTATPVGGTFSGPGMSNDTFYPAIAGVGNDTVRYTVTNGCGTFTGIRVIKVINGTLPTVNLNPTYCVSDADVTLNPNPKCGQFSGPGITTAGACLFGSWIANPVFSPSTAGIGNHTLTYSGAGCANTFKVQVLGAGAAPVISGAGGPYCLSSPTITLTGSPAGGTFTGPGMTGAIFNPAVAGIGTHTITYTVFACGSALTNTKQIQVVSGSGSASIAYSPNTFCNSVSTPQNVTRTGTAGGTYTASPAGLSINASTGAITPSASAINSYTVTYTIPASGGCSQFTTTASVTISSGITPTFTAISPICQNALAPTLPTRSNDSIIGVWNPTNISTSTVGTTTYTFTPNAGQCASNKTMDITIAPLQTTNISQSICNGSSIVFNGQTITTAGTYRDTLTTSLGCDSFIVLTTTIKPTPTTNITQAICNGGSIVFNGQTITSAGTFRDTLTTSLGCDSFIVLTTTIKPSPTTNIAQSICNGGSIVFNGQTITTAGTFRDTLTTSLGCDSFIVLTTTIKPSPTTNIAQSICNGGSIVFNGQTITTAGTFRDTLTTSLGCDSFIVLTTTIKPTPTTNITQAICNGGSIVFNGQTITTAGTYRDTLSTSLGCDSFIVLTVTIQSTPTTNIAQAICNGGSIVFNGQTITTAGTFRDTLTTSLGCDSFIVLTVTIQSTPTTNISQAICNGGSIVFNGQTITTAGTFRDTLTTSLGCDSFIVLTTTIKPSPTTNIAQSICNGGSIVFNGQTITTAGTFRDTLTTSLGCDSFIVLTTTIKPTPTTNITQAICNGGSIVFNGQTITTAGTYRDTLSTSLGCDSFIVLTVTIQSTPTTNIAQAICNGGSIVFNGQTITTAGTFRDTLTTSLGCDSFIVLTVTIQSTPTTNISQAICNGGSIVFNGQTITTAGTFRDTLTTSLGCDSFIVLTTTIKPSPTTNIAQSICNGGSIVFNGQTITTAGTFRDTLTTSLGCDSFIVLTTTIKPTPTTNIAQSICNGSSIVFNGQTITTAGTFRDTLTTSLGCDSFIVLTTTIKPTPTTNIVQSICNGSSIVFNGQTITTAGTFRDTLTTSLGCDSFIVLTVTIQSTPTTNISQAICNGGSIVFNGQTITTAGTFRDTLTTSLGCDSFIVLTTTIKPTPTTNISQAICQGSSITFNGNTITTAGTYRDTLTTSLGCDSFIVLTTTIKPTPTTNIAQAICNGSSITFNGNTITTAGTFRDTLVTLLGCDSFIVLTTTIKPTPTTNISQAICNGSSIVFNGQTITTAGTYRDTLTTSLGCDSFIVLTTTIKPTTTTNIAQSICNGSSIVFNGQTITTAGTFRDTLTTSLGCDSFIVLTTTIKPTPTTNIAQAICNGGSIVFNGQTITTAGTFRDTLTTSLGCDSFIVLTTTIKPTPTTNISQAICNGGSIVFNGQTVTTAGTFRDTLTTSLGCDSFIVLTTTIKPTPTTNIAQAICNGSSIVFNGQTITTAGTYRDTLVTSLGCDSFIVLTTTIKPTPTTNIAQAICNGSSITFNGNTITTAGTYRDTLTTSLGCDSFIVLTVTIKPTPTTNISQSICNGGSIVFNGQTITTAGTFRDTLTTSLGCDSFIVLTTTIKPTPTTNIAQAICQGSSITFNGNTITTAGIYRDTLSTSLGCDSFIVLTTTIKPTPTTNITQSICNGSSIVFNGQTITTAGTYRDTLTTSLGCDSFIVLTVTVKPTKTTSISQSICSGHSIVFNGQTISAAGVYRDTLLTSQGCDSFIILTLSVNSVIRTTLTPSICMGSSVTVGSHTYSATGTYRDTLISAQGCDSIITTNLTVNPTPTTNTSRAICNGSSTTFNGNTITTAGTYRDTLTTSLGCDSFVILTVTVKPTPTTNITQAICQGSSTTFNGNTITTAGTYRDTLTTSLGCDSFVVLTVTIKPVKTTNIAQAICNNSSIVFNGNTITTAGTYRDTLTTSLGCDSFVILTVTVKPTPTTNISRSICQGSSTTFNGQTITSAGTYRDTLTTSLGCDSFVVLTVTVKPTPTTSIAQSICQGSSVAFNGLNITTSGVYRDTLTTSLGCDSFIVFTVTVNPRPTTNISRAICQGNSTTFNGQTITAAGTFRDTLTTSLGCDSFVVLTVTVNPLKTTNVSKAICNGTNYPFNGQLLTAAGTYRDTLTQVNGCDSFIVLTLTVNPTYTPAVSIVSTKSDICKGDQVVFTATASNTGVPNPSYQWYLNGNPVGTNSAQYSTTTLNDSDQVEVKVTSTATCVTSATAMSNAIVTKVSAVDPVIPLIKYCTGESAVIDLQIPQTGYSIVWKNGSDTFTTTNIDTAVVSNTTTGNMQFTIKYGNGCSKTGNVPITVNQLPVISAIVDKPDAKYEEEVQLNVNGSTNNNYNWLPASLVSNDSIKNPTAVITATTLFIVTAKDKNGCVSTDSVQVNLINECTEAFIYVPSAFSPNGDGINDCFKIVSPPRLTNYKMVIFDRWNEKVFEANNTTDCWNGMYKGGEAQSDSYVYVISYTCYNGAQLYKKGVITLLK